VCPFSLPFKEDKFNTYNINFLMDGGGPGLTPSPVEHEWTVHPERIRVPQWGTPIANACVVLQCKKSNLRYEFLERKTLESSTAHLGELQVLRDQHAALEDKIGSMTLELEGPEEAKKVEDEESMKVDTSLTKSPKRLFGGGMFGKSPKNKDGETTPKSPKSPFGKSRFGFGGSRPTTPVSDESGGGGSRPTTPSRFGFSFGKNGSRPTTPAGGSTDDKPPGLPAASTIEGAETTQGQKPPAKVPVEQDTRQAAVEAKAKKKADAQARKKADAEAKVKKKAETKEAKAAAAKAKVDAKAEKAGASMEEEKEREEPTLAEAGVDIWVNPEGAEQAEGAQEVVAEKKGSLTVITDM
jgi:hypothetical protein